MRLLHLSDFHFKSSEKDLATQSILINRLILKLESVAPVDYILFTGDLVFSGTDFGDFDSAVEQLLKPVAEALKVEKTNVLICPGNHDIDRKKIVVPVKEYIRKIATPEEITQVVENNDPNVYGLSLGPLDNYNKFIQNFYKYGIVFQKDVVTPLFSIHFRQKDNQKIGFVAINTAWQCSGDDDRGNLIFPKSELDKIIYQLNEHKVDLKILLLHHPLTDLKEFNKLEIEDIIYSEFHLMFSGHLHKREDFIKFTFNEGIFGSYANAAFTKREDGKIGFSVFEMQIDTFEIKLEKFIYDHEERVFLNLEPIVFAFPHNQTKNEQIKILKTLRKRYLEINDKSNELFVSTKDLVNINNFNDLFVDPVLRDKPDIEIGEALANSKKYSFQMLLDGSNYLIFAKDKTGKTSLLFKLNLEILKNYSHYGSIPFYLDLSEFKTRPEKLDIVRLFHYYIEHNLDSTKTIIKKYSLKLLIDNFDPNQTSVIAKLSKFLYEFPNCSFIILADQTLVRTYDKLDYGIGKFKMLFIHDISRTEIRLLARKWPNIPTERKEEFIDKIIDVLKQHSMPFNFWTLSIFLWIFAGKNTLNFNNNSELIELYIDDLLDRNRLASDAQNRFSYQNYKLLLSELAYELLKNYTSTNYSMKYSDLTSFTERFMNQNLRRVGTTSEIVSYLLNKGVLTNIDNDFISFRLNGVFEYFIAYNFIENKEFLKTILEDDLLYLSFKNEFEIYSGFTRSGTENQQFMHTIFGKTKTAFADLNLRMGANLDFRLHSTMAGKPVFDISQPLAQVLNSDELNPLTDEEKDDFYNSQNLIPVSTSEVKPKKIYDTSLKNFDTLERYLLMNGRVFRNIENINDKDLINEVFDFIIESSCNLGFSLIEEFESTNSHENSSISENNIHKLIMHLFSNYLPLVVQAFVTDAIGNINLESMINEKIRHYQTTNTDNQYKLFILYGLLLDLDFKKYKHLIDDMFEVSKMNIIKHSILIKLFNLLLFKSFDDDRTINFLKEKIRSASMLINPKIDMNNFNRNFDKTYKLLLLKRQAK